MKAHKYWSIGAVSVYTGHKMISGKKKAKKQAEAKEVEE